MVQKWQPINNMRFCLGFLLTFYRNVLGLVKISGIVVRVTRFNGLHLRARKMLISGLLLASLEQLGFGVGGWSAGPLRGL